MRGVTDAKAQANDANDVRRLIAQVPREDQIIDRSSLAPSRQQDRSRLQEHEHNHAGVPSFPDA
jgi:hypothetical protein